MEKIEHGILVFNNASDEHSIFKVLLELHLNNYFFSTYFIQISEYVEHNDAILLVVIPATQAPEISLSRALKIVKEFDAESGFFTVNLAFSNFFKKNSSFISSLLSFAHPFLMIFY